MVNITLSSMISIIQWNINGYFNNYQELYLLINSLRPSIILLQETHIKSDNTPVTPKEYIGYFFNTPHSNKCKEGVGILVRRNIPHCRIDIKSKLPSIGIQVYGSVKLSVISTYIPPSMPFTTSDLHSLLNQAKPPFIIGGDLNSWSTIWGSPVSNSRGHIIENTISAANISCLNDGSVTHFSTHKTFTHVDVTFCSPTLIPISFWKTLPDLHGSDHFPISININWHMNSHRYKFNSRFLTDKAKWNVFQAACDKLSLASTISSNVNQEAANILKIIRTAANIAIPSSKPCSLPKSIVWWSAELKKLREIKQQNWHIFKKNMSDSNLIQYKKSNALFRRKMREAKKQAFQNLTSKINPSTSPKMIWADIKKLVGVPRNPLLKLLNTVNGTVDTPTDIANCLGTFFTQVSANTAFSKSFLCSKTTILNKQYTPKNPLSISASILDSQFSLNELSFALKKAKGTTPGIDKITYVILTNTSNFVKQRLISLFNNIMETGIWPHSWKLSIIIPIQKPNTLPNDTTSYRPISLISCLSKTLEKLLARRILWYAESNGFLKKNQVAFRQNSNTMDAIVYLDHQIKSSLAQKAHVTLVAVDFQKAFDRIGVHVVLRQLSKWNVGIKIYNVIKSFLTNRQCRIKVNGILSEVFNLQNGTPQGSPLSVLLFLIAFNEISDIVNRNNGVYHTIYADDLILFTKGKSVTNITHSLKNTINDIMAWGTEAGATISVKKTKIIHFCKKRNCPSKSINIKINDTKIDNVNSLKILGLFFDSKYLFHEHVKYIRHSLINRVNIIKYFSSNHSLAHPNSLISITKALILSKIDYGLAVYGHCAKTHLRLLHAPYHQAIRRCLYAFPTTPIKNLLREAGMPRIEDRVEDLTALLIAKIIYKGHSLLQDLFASNAKGDSKRKHSSALQLSIQFAKKYNIALGVKVGPSSLNADWNIDESIFIQTLCTYAKNTTPSIVYQKIFLEIFNELKKDNYAFTFTDGSKGRDYTAYAVVDNGGDTIRSGLLYDFCSNYSAELVAIFFAVQHAIYSGGKFVICTDSKACFLAIQKQHNSSIIIRTIRHHLSNCKGKIKIMWVPGHAGISGNDHADNQAKSVIQTPSITTSIVTINDIKWLIKNARGITQKIQWMQYRHQYSEVNPTGAKLQLQSLNNTKYLRPYIRLRLGHTSLTHGHLLSNSRNNHCPKCGGVPTLDHLLNTCPATLPFRQSFFGDKPIIHLLKTPNTQNINLIHSFLSSSKLLPFI